ncbi:MAG TPA: RagB/SusD family nutrient uptake outer membrane protein, partial [Cyclobacteriaceae bacterium]|nr:RagB/SusD family nutrient uptake outer membrane protein [Cyclobacteriaceae bacterium]
MRKFKIFFSALSLMIATSCGLDVKPLVQVSDANYYSNPDQAYTALVGCYDGLQVVWASGVSLPVASEIFSDNAFGGTGNSDGFSYQMIDEFDKTRSTADQNTFQDNWSAYYKAVFRCNTLIGKLPQVNWGTTPQLQATYEAEARYLRAYLYFDMVRLWGN